MIHLLLIVSFIPCTSRYAWRAGSWYGDVPGKIYIRILSIVVLVHVRRLCANRHCRCCFLLVLAFHLPWLKEVTFFLIFFEWQHNPENPWEHLPHLKFLHSRNAIFSFISYYPGIIAGYPLPDWTGIPARKGVVVNLWSAPGSYCNIESCCRAQGMP